jgi:hypothetical protein
MTIRPFLCRVNGEWWGQKTTYLIEIWVILSSEGEIGEMINHS